MHGTPLGFRCRKMLDMESVDTSVASAGIGSGSCKWHGIAAAGTKVYGVPFAAEQLLVMETTTRTVTGYGILKENGDQLHTSGMKESWIDIAAHSNGQWLVAVPYDAQHFLLVDTTTEPPTIARQKISDSGVVIDGALARIPSRDVGS